MKGTLGKVDIIMSRIDAAMKNLNQEKAYKYLEIKEEDGIHYLGKETKREKLRKEFYRRICVYQGVNLMLAIRLYA